MTFKRKDIKEYLPIGILTLIGMASIVQILLTDYVFQGEQYIGLTLLAVCNVLFFIQRRLYKYFATLTLLLGTFTLAAFTVTIISIGFFGIPIQIIPFVLLLVLAVIYRNDISNRLSGILSPSEEDAKDRKSSRINSFKTKFQNLTDAEIDSKLNQDLVPEAVLALEELKTERSEKKNEP